MRLYDKSTAQNPDEEDDYQYQGKRRDQVEYSDKMAVYLIIAVVVIIAFLVWELKSL